MSVLLFVAGAIAVMSGVGMVGYGIPINEFSFGNTLIIAGTTAIVGGLIVIAIGAAVSYLQRISEALAARTPARAGRTADAFEPAADVPAAPLPNRIPFPPKLKSEAGAREPLAPDTRMPVPAEMPAAEWPAAVGAPVLPNPEAPVAEPGEMPMPPQFPARAPARPDRPDIARRAPPPGVNGSGAAERRPEPAPEAAWGSPPAPPRRPAQPLPNFDAMWPAEPKPAASTAGNEAPPEQRSELPPPREAVEPPEPPRQEPPRTTAAILKSGVVDGMAYTLYVDGSIEAELPQGTLHFASINELRSHLSKGA